MFWCPNVLVQRGAVDFSEQFEPAIVLSTVAYYAWNADIADFDGDGLRDDALADFDGDGVVDHVVLDLDNDGTPEAYFTDDGSGSWAVAVDRGGNLRWFGLDGIEHLGGPLVDFDGGDGSGRAADRLIDSDGNGVADRVLCPGENGVTAYVDTDGDGKWDLRLTDTDGDGLADGAAPL